MKQFLTIVLLLTPGVLLAPSILLAQGVTLHAQFYPQEHLEVNMQWASPLHNARDRSRENIVLATTNLTELRLTIPPSYVGSSHKVYLQVPNQFSGIRGRAVEVQWESRGIFSSNSAKPGDKVLLYDGPVNDVVLSDQISFTFTIDARAVFGPIEFHPVYIIE